MFFANPHALDEAVANNHLPGRLNDYRRKVVEANEKIQPQCEESFLDFLFPPLQVADDGNSAVVAGPIHERLYTQVFNWLSTTEANQPLLRINSFGGDGFAGLGISNLLREYDNVNTIVDGAAYSAGSLIFMGGKERLMGTGTMIGVHRASILAYGNEEDFAELVDDLRFFDSLMLELYMTKAKIGKRKMKELVDADTMLNATDAISYGLATGNYEKEQKKATKASASVEVVDVSQKPVNKGFDELPLPSLQAFA